VEAYKLLRMLLGHSFETSSAEGSDGGKQIASDTLVSSLRDLSKRERAASPRVLLCNICNCLCMCSAAAFPVSSLRVVAADKSEGSLSTQSEVALEVSSAVLARFLLENEEPKLPRGLEVLSICLSRKNRIVLGKEPITRCHGLGKVAK